jgi:hypothetical protein
MLLWLTGSSAFAQDQGPENPKCYLGIGIGFDYGGAGGKIEYLPVKNIGVFAGAGLNLLSLGWNIGGTYKILPDSKVSPNLMAMYGYNAVFVGADPYAKQYEMTSYGISVGANFDIKVGGRGNKISVGLFVPFRSGKFKDNYEKAKNDPNMNITSLFPIGFSVGYNFGL